MNGCLSGNTPLLQTVAETLSLKEITGLIARASKERIDFLSEVTLNLVANKDCQLPSKDKKTLKPYKRQLYIIVDKCQTVTKRRAALKSEPSLVKHICKLALVLCANE